jgi:hypothetical protein
MPVPIDHFHRSPPVPIHDLTDARATLEQRGRGMMPKVVQPHTGHARICARTDEGSRDGVRVVWPLASRVRREDVTRGIESGVALLGSRISSLPVSFLQLHRLRTDSDATDVTRLRPLDLASDRNSND